LYGNRDVMRLPTNHTFALSYEAEAWIDSELKADAGQYFDVSHATFSAAILLEGGACHMRLAFGQDTEGGEYANVAEWRCALSPGVNLFRFTVQDLVVLRGDVDHRLINHISFGGRAAYCRIVAQLCQINP
jgi:hypothetical protein